MDSLTTAAALAAGDAISAQKHVALHGDLPALALRGIAMAQLGEYPSARELLKRAARGFGSHEAPAMRDLGGATRPLLAARPGVRLHRYSTLRLHKVGHQETAYPQPIGSGLEGDSTLR